ncbi:WD40 repeat domain-containing protein, partial [Candidatus Bathyarchaeota archaeon]|nr:WD40 repeat domain-containing protein [Candidatus Bathyarchaeota archaeon]
MPAKSAKAETDDHATQPRRPPPTRWFKLHHRPYVNVDDRKLYRDAIENKGLASLGSGMISHLPLTYHVDFSEEEIEYVWQEAQALVSLSKVPRDPIRGIKRALRKTPSIASTLPERIRGTGPVAARDELDLYYFLSDVNYEKISRDPKVYSFCQQAPSNTAEDARAKRVAALRSRREIEGQSPFGRGRVFGGIKHDILRTREDGLEVRAVWTNCAGDIATLTWVSESAFVCGTTEHSDAHNQQYNRPGNLLLGSTEAGTLRAYPDHRIQRPRVTKGENASEAMRQSQDPWLYSSVVSSAYDSKLDIAYTSSFDHTVKAWKVDPSGKAMQLAGTWPHRGIVNFVVTSHHEEEHFVATATDVADKAVRIYTVNPEKISSSTCSTWGPMMTGVGDPSAEPSAWAYYPATIQWAIAKNCSHHLLVGYSPRALSGDDNDIPETKRNTGEMRMINAKTEEMIPMGIPLCQNIFEVVWHPTRAVFIVAMTRGASKAEVEVRTQIRVFQYQPKPSSNATSAPFQPESNGFAPHEEVPEEMYCFMMVLDCFSSDINELTLNPNSYEYFYATAACTDGKVYVWDTARGHRPIHVLSHGKPVDEYIDNREREDTGCKFTAWGSTPDRLYTGGSDGVVKVWDVKRPKHEPFLRDLLEVSGPVSSGAFSPDKSKLAIGDASGRVYLLSVDESDNVAEDTVKLPLAGGLYNTTTLTRSVHRPKPYIPHPEPAPPPNHYPKAEETDPDSGVLRGRNYLQKGQLYRHGNPVLGVFQGPNYGELGLYRREAHWDEDPSNPLLADAERNQQDNKLPSRSRRGGIGARISSG